MSDDSLETQGQPEDPRVRFAAERTLLAWMRTCLALMGFGFVVARFGLFLREIALAGHLSAHQNSMHWSLWIGVGLIGLGVVTSLTASTEYLRFLRHGRAHKPRTAMLAVVVGAILAVLGTVMAVYLIMISR